MLQEIIIQKLFLTLVIEEYKLHSSTKCNEINNEYHLNPNACVGYISIIRFFDMETNCKSDVQQTAVMNLTFDCILA